MQKGFFVFGLLVIGMIVAAMCSFSMEGSSADSELEISLIKAALQDQEAACGASLEVEYTVDWGKVGSSDARDRLVRSNYYIRTPEAFRLDVVQENGTIRKSVWDRSKGETRNLHIAVDGSVEYAEVYPRKANPFLMQDHLETVHFPLYVSKEIDSSLVEQVTRGNVVSKEEEIDGQICWYLEIPAPSSMLDRFKNYRVWLDPSIGFCPRRIEIPWNDKKATVIMFKDYRAVNDSVWFPFEQIVESEGSPGTLPNRLVNTVKEVRTGRNLPPKELAVSFPSGTEVVVREIDATVTWP